MGFFSNFLFRFLIYSSILIFVIKIYNEKIYKSKDYIDLFKFFVSKIPLNHDFSKKINFYLEEHLERIILVTGVSSLFSIFGMRIFSLITFFLYGVLAISNFLITKEIFNFNFYHISQEFLLKLGPLFLIPLIELNLVFSQQTLEQKSSKKIA